MKKEDFVAVSVYGFLCVVILLTCASHFVFNSDWLDFFGSLIASVATIIAVVMTLMHSNKQYMKSQTAGVRPYLTLSIIDYNYATRQDFIKSKNIQVKAQYIAENNHWTYKVESDLQNRTILCVLKNIGMDTLVKGYIYLNKECYPIESLSKNEEYFFYVTLKKKDTEIFIECIYEDLLTNEYVQSTYWDIIGIHNDGVIVGGVVGSLSEPKRTV